MSTNQDRGLVLRTKALALLQEAEKADGLKPFAVTHTHHFGATTYLLWAKEAPSEQEAAAALEADFEPEKGETLDVEGDFTLDELCGVAVTARLDAIPDALAEGHSQHQGA